MRNIVPSQLPLNGKIALDPKWVANNDCFHVHNMPFIGQIADPRRVARVTYL